MYSGQIKKINKKAQILYIMQYGYKTRGAFKNPIDNMPVWNIIPMSI